VGHVVCAKGCNLKLKSLKNVLLEKAPHARIVHRFSKERKKPIKNSNNRQGQAETTDRMQRNNILAKDPKYVEARARCVPVEQLLKASRTK
jgi:hypothetical protein